jgi:hypothetical protein
MAKKTTDPVAVVPPAPSSFTASPVGSGQVNLAWSAVTGAVGYIVERFTQVGTTTGTSLTDTGLPANSTHTYRVRAKDSAGDLGDYSNTATTTTGAASGGGSAPVVSPASFSCKLPMAAGYKVGTMTATNNPTSWVITKQ